MKLGMYIGGNVFIIYVSTDILGQIDYFSDIENLVSFERAMLADYDFKYSMIEYLFLMLLLPLWNTCLKNHKQYICQI